MTCGLLSAAAAAAFFFLLPASAAKGIPTAHSNRAAVSAFPIPDDFLLTLNIVQNLLLSPLRQVFVAAGAKCLVIGLVVHQQIGLRRCMWLMTRQAVHLGPNLAGTGWIHHVGHRVPVDRMTESIFQRQDDDLIPGVVVFGQLHGAVEDRDQVLRL